jgi:signal transduction histidine kinase
VSVGYFVALRVARPRADLDADRALSGAKPLAMVSLAFGASAIVACSELALGRHGTTLNASAFMLLLLYSLFRWGAGWEILVGLPVIVGCGALGLAAQHAKGSDVIGAFAVVALSLSLGAALRFQDRAQRRELEQVKLREREHLARDLHDTVAHHVSAIAISAQAGLATAAVKPDAPLDALRVIEAEASRTLVDMRAMVRVLRRDEPRELAPTPGILDLERLLEPSDAGPEIALRISGDVAQLPSAISAAVYRLAQESITNARRHAKRARRIDVSVSIDDVSVKLLVSDDGERPERKPARPGYGLLGMAERTEQLGGTFEAAPNADRGWTVTAVLPRQGPSP